MTRRIFICSMLVQILWLAPLALAAVSYAGQFDIGQVEDGDVVKSGTRLRVWIDRNELSRLGHGDTFYSVHTEAGSEREFPVECRVVSPYFSWWPGERDVEVIAIKLRGQFHPAVTARDEIPRSGAWADFSLLEDIEVRAEEIRSAAAVVQRQAREEEGRLEREAAAVERQRRESRAKFFGLLKAPLKNPLRAALVLHGLAALIATAQVWRRSQSGGWESLQTRLVYQKLFWTRFYLISLPLVGLGTWLAVSVLSTAAEDEIWPGWKWLAGAGIGLVLAVFGQFTTAHLHVFRSQNGEELSRVGVVRRTKPAAPSPHTPPADAGLSDDW